MLRIRELSACPNVDHIVCHVVEAHLRVQLGNIALEGARHSEAVEYFTAAVNASASFYKLPIHLLYDEFVVLFGWDLKSLWQTAHQQQCCAFFRAGSFGTAIESYQSIMDKIDEDLKADLRACQQLYFTQLSSKIETRSMLPTETMRLPFHSYLDGSCVAQIVLVSLLSLEITSEHCLVCSYLFSITCKPANLYLHRQIRSSELDEPVRSMFKWYGSHECASSTLRSRAEDLE
ncbi:uncharacterized protein EDB93DRAFT_1108477 [Suillus bovinus]|uniref:uncharacterized protein n=1 Tax=Suillus bovinus TaxID=48563 RepID=UPI001B884AEE|nr:uncharacterized protein EDB93DRAFT_1108477 [Suillus bovinus]KAG2130189.1 hypothetical protein EDB93DRAFT_1108477 [Suillus bovinus]